MGRQGAYIQVDGAQVDVGFFQRFFAQSESPAVQRKIRVQPGHGPQDPQTEFQRALWGDVGESQARSVGYIGLQSDGQRRRGGQGIQVGQMP